MNAPGASNQTLATRHVVGNCFVNPYFDYVIVGGLWSILAAGVFLYRPTLVQGMDMFTLAVLILLVNSAHFAASTVRLYSKPIYFQDHPFVTLALPIITLLGLTVFILVPNTLGKHLQALSLTWSPYHYAAQTYGLVVMYSFRSGCRLTNSEKTLLWWTCMLPFLRAFLGAPDSGLGWFVSRETLATITYLPSVLFMVTDVIFAAIFVVPAVLAWRIYSKKRQFLPLICLVLMLSNGLWWTVLDFVDGFVVATIAHGLQYLAIVIVYHVRERLRESDNKHAWLVHALSFYGKCLLLGYGLFYCWPHAYVWAGAGLVESMLLVSAAINIHHFVVDRYIWRLSTPANTRTMMDAPVTGSIPGPLTN